VLCLRNKFFCLTGTGLFITGGLSYERFDRLIMPDGI